MHINYTHFLPFTQRFSPLLVPTVQKMGCPLSQLSHVGYIHSTVSNLKSQFLSLSQIKSKPSYKAFITY